MSQVVGNPSAGIGGIQLGLGLNGVGQLVYLFAAGDPNTLTDPSILRAAVGSLFSRLDAPDSTHALYVRTAFPANTWTAK
jgi:hypothetical protein